MKLAFALILPTLVGFLFASWLLRNDEEMTVFDRIFFGYGLGLGFVSYGMFILGILGIKYTAPAVIFSQILFIVGISALFVYSRMSFSNIFGYKGYKTKLKTPAKGMNKWQYLGMGILLLWILWKASFVLYEGLARPIYSWDVWANWAAGAKFFFYEKGLNLDLDSEFFFGKWYRAFLGHPLHNPLLQVWVSLSMGEFHEIYAKAWAPFYFISLLGIFFFAVKRETSLLTALIATFFLSSAPFLTYHATDAYSDLPMGYYAFAGVITFWRYIKTCNRNLLILCGVFIGMGMFTKNEGIFFAAAILISFGIFIFLEKRHDKISALYFLIPVIIIIGPWILLKSIYNIEYGHGITQKFVGIDIALQAVKEFAEVLFLEANFNVIFVFLFIATVLNIKALFKEDTKYLFIITIFAALMFFSVYIMSLQEFNESLVQRMAVNRNMLTYLPIAYFLASMLAFRLWFKKAVSEKT